MFKMLQPFCKLADPANYVACNWDLRVDQAAREYWIAFFLQHIKLILKLGIEAAIARGEQMQNIEARAEKFERQFIDRFNAFRANPVANQPVTILTLDIWRDGLLRDFGFNDAFVDLKDRENEKTLPLLRAVCREHDSLQEPARLRTVIEGVFAGNIFDMGAAATAQKFLGASPDFFQVRQTLPPRPWLIDDFDALASTWNSRTYRKAILFVDNAGSDFLLGALPMARWLAQRGTKVILAANELPTLNDMTIADIRRWWLRAVEVEPSLKSLPIDFVSTGTGEPLIDLSQVSPELNLEAADADLVILEGMGRGIETNLDASFTCDVLNIAMLKDKMIAQRHGGLVFDVVCRFRGVT